MRENHEDGLRKIAEAMQSAGMDGAAEYCRQAAHAFGRRDRALANIKQAWFRWYKGSADAYSILMDVEAFAVGPWIQEEIEADSRMPNSEAAPFPLEVEAVRVLKYLREIGEQTRGESAFPSAEYADAMADGLEHALMLHAEAHGRKPAQEKKETP